MSEDLTVATDIVSGFTVLMNATLMVAGVWNVAFNGMVSGSRADIVTAIEQLSEKIMTRDTRGGTIIAAGIEEQGQS